MYVLTELFPIFVYSIHVAGLIDLGGNIFFSLHLGGQEFYTKNRYIAKILLSIILRGQIHVGFSFGGHCPLAPLQLRA